ncbi:hypothetical protein BU24DRAFT_460639 [Aaosphaeria arxii CBS 175.79]|uniref:Uncharacterized protein n=1 Tax=Aaosphaeria arxii CBS 175.79 TaxID=1450172 RepID=A0A6A5XXC2_9PLEO|nr:uncharacterized protein BU24DRAFT_460639 [Aaosphaeria arxii CBS 175.79]KAF2017619.1 hypothetical protein BU24DRAFT_460639 [Aaosphaeria arxii CBS 175.79]
MPFTHLFSSKAKKPLRGIAPPQARHLPHICRDFAWTSKLIRRDVKNLCRAGKNKAKAKVKQMFASNNNPAIITNTTEATDLFEPSESFQLITASESTTSTESIAPTEYYTATESIAPTESTIPTEPTESIKYTESAESTKSTKSTKSIELMLPELPLAQIISLCPASMTNITVPKRAVAVQKKPSLHMQKASMSSTETTQTEIFSMKINSSECSVATTAGTITTKAEVSNDLTICIPECGSLHKYLRQLFVPWCEATPRDDSHAERWLNRGTRLVLDTIIEQASSNNSFDLLRGDQAHEDGADFILGLDRLITTHGGHDILAMLQYAQVMASLAAPAESHKDTCSCVGTINSNAAVPPVLLWAAVLVGLKDRAITRDIVAVILGLAWPEVDANMMISKIGNPANRWWNSDEVDEVRQRLRRVLSPEVEALFN